MVSLTPIPRATEAMDRELSTTSRGSLVTELRREFFLAGDLHPTLPDGPYWRSAVRKARGPPGSAGSFMLPHELAGQRTGTGFRRNILVMAGVVTALTVSLLIAGLMSLRSSTRSEASTSALSTSAPPQLTVDQLQVGDCLRGSGMGLDSSSAWPDLVTAVPCTQRHTAEVFFAGNAWPQSLAAYPGDDAVNNTANDRCDTAFAAYDGTTPDESAFTYDSITPDSSTWPDGDRSLVCVAYMPASQYPGGAAVNYSIKGSGR